MHRFRTFGPPQLVGPSGETVPAGPRRLALLAVVAAVGAGGITRDKLIAILWPDADQERARHNLNQALYALRVEARAELIAGSAVLRLDPTVCTADVVEFDEAIADRAGEALARYTGRFLDGFHLSGSPGFEEWLDAEQTLRARQAVEAAVRVAEAAGSAGDRAAAVGAWRRAADLDPLSARPALGLMEALACQGDLAGALRHAETHAARVRVELDADPDPAVAGLAAELRTRAPAPRALPPTTPLPRPEPVPAGVTEADTVPAAPAGWPPRRLGAWIGTGLALAVLAAAVLAMTGTLGKRGSVDYRAREYFVLGGFLNGTGDSLLGRVVSPAFASAIAQSPRLIPLPAARIDDALHRMGLAEADGDLGRARAREVAEREGVRLVVIGDIVAVGAQIQLSTHIVDAISGADLCTRVVRIDGSADLLAALDRLAGRLRRDLGEAAGVVSRAIPLPRATTASLPALRLYYEARRAARSGDWGPASDRLQAAVRLDSTFALAQAMLGEYYARNNLPDSAEPRFRAALAQDSRLPQPESLRMRGMIAFWRGELDDAVRALHSYLVEYPRDAEVWTELGYYLMRADRVGEALAAYDSAAGLAPLDPLDHIAVGNLYSARGETDRATMGADMDSALAHYDRAMAEDSALLTRTFYNHQYGRILIARGDTGRARAVFERMLTQSGFDRARGLRSLGYLDAWEGRWRTAARRFAAAASTSRADQQATSALRNELLQAMVLNEGGWGTEAGPPRRRAAEIVREQIIEPRFARYAAIELLRAGDRAGGGALAERIAAGVRTDDFVSMPALLQIRAEAALARGDAGAARDSLLAVMARDSSDYVRYSLARAIAASGDLEAAAEEFARLERRYGFGTEGQFGVMLAPYWVGRFREERGDTAAALAAYSRLLATFAGAPADEAPVVVADARRRVSELRRGR